MNREEKIRFINEELLNTAEVMELLGVTRMRINQMIQKGKIAPVKTYGNGALFLKEDVFKRKEELVELREKYLNPWAEIQSKPMMAILPDGKQIEALSRNEMAKILQKECDISLGVITKLAQSEKPFQPKLKRHEILRGMVIKYVEAE